MASTAPAAIGLLETTLVLGEHTYFEVFVAGSAGIHVAQTDLAFGDRGELCVEKMAEHFLLLILDVHIDILTTFDDRNLVRHPGRKESCFVAAWPVPVSYEFMFDLYGFVLCNTFICVIDNVYFTLVLGCMCLF